MIPSHSEWNLNPHSPVMWFTDSQTTSVSWVAGPLRATIIWYRQCCHPPCTNWFSDYTHIVECISTKMQPTFLWMFLNSDHFKTITAVNWFRWNCALTRQITRRFRQFCQHLSCCCEIGKQPLRWKDDLKRSGLSFQIQAWAVFLFVWGGAVTGVLEYIIDFFAELRKASVQNRQAKVNS